MAFDVTQVTGSPPLVTLQYKVTTLSSGLDGATKHSLVLTGIPQNWTPSGARLTVAAGPTGGTQAAGYASYDPASLVIATSGTTEITTTVAIDVWVFTVGGATTNILYITLF